MSLNVGNLPLKTKNEAPQREKHVALMSFLSRAITRSDASGETICLSPDALDKRNTQEFLGILDTGTEIMQIPGNLN